MLVELDTIGAVGVVRDDRPYRLDPATWSDLVNVRALDGNLQSIGGRQQVFGTPTAAPSFVIPLSTNAETFWIYASLVGAYVWNGATHTVITRAAGAYTAASYEVWNGVVFGGILILNNGADVPQRWATPTVATLLTNLPNWDANHRARVMRALGPFLVAINITKSGTNFAHMVKWSHPADPGSVPASWDQTDPTRDAGETDLPDVNSGVLVDALNLRGQLFLYKESATWRMRFVGGTSIFAFDSFLDTAGLLASRCVGLTSDGQKHFMVTNDDILLHNGNSAQSIFGPELSPGGRARLSWRKYLFSQIDSTAFTKSFVFPQPNLKEMWFCYPTEGSANPNMAFIWNEETGTISEAEIDFVGAASGPVAVSSTDTWASVVGAWGTSLLPWAQVQRREVIVANKAATQLQQLEVGNLFGTSLMSTRVQRTGLALAGQKRDKSPIVNFNKRKMVTRLWPRISGGPVQIRMGSQAGPEGPVAWQTPQDFDPASQQYLDVVVEGTALALEVSSRADVAWQFEGYKLDMFVDGSF